MSPSFTVGSSPAARRAGHTPNTIPTVAENRNAFADASNAYGLSDVARSYMADTIWSISRGFCDQSGVMSMSIRLFGRFDGG